MVHPEEFRKTRTSGRTFKVPEDLSGRTPSSGMFPEEPLLPEVVFLFFFVFFFINFFKQKLFLFFLNELFYLFWLFCFLDFMKNEVWVFDVIFFL